MNKLRLTVQLLFTAVTNGYLYGFLNGKIYRGSLKYLCVPGLNCYSCPGAVASCPIGALQALLNRQGLEGLFERGDVRSSLARPRRQEILACVNRYRELIV